MDDEVAAYYIFLSLMQALVLLLTISKDSTLKNIISDRMLAQQHLMEDYLLREMCGRCREEGDGGTRCRDEVYSRKLGRTGYF